MPKTARTEKRAEKAARVSMMDFPSRYTPPRMSDLRLYNTLSREKETFIPLRPGEARMYSCGPTVYGDPHIGNLRTFLWSDLLRRWLEYRGLRVTQVMNITDVEDKIIRNAAAKGQDIFTYVAPYIDAFHAALAKL